MRNSGMIESLRRFFEALEVSRIKREFKGWWNILYKLIAASYSLFLIVAAIYGRITPQMIRGFFILFISILIFLKYPWGKNSPLHRPSLFDFILIAFSICTFGNFAINYDDMSWRAGSPTRAMSSGASWQS